MDPTLELQQNILATLEKINGTMSQNNDLLTKTKGISESVRKNFDKITDSYDDLNKSQKEYNKQLKATSVIAQGLEEVFSRLKKLALGLFGLTAILDFAKSVFKLNKGLRDTSFRMGQGTKGLGEMQKAMQQVKLETGASNEVASELLTNIVKITGTTKDLGTLTTAAERFARVTGVSSEDAARLTGDLTRMGKLGADQVGRVELSMMQVQRAVGMTEGEMSSLTQTTIKTTKLLQQMGKSSADIEKFSIGTAKLAGAFRSVGIEAEEALGFVEKLLDPSLVEENALLYSKLGISIQDAFAGNVDPGQLVGKFKDLGTQFKSMNPAAAAAFAKEMNMSLGTLRQFADMDSSKFEKAMTAAGGDWKKAMASMETEQTGPMEKLERMASQLLSVLDPVINWVEGALNKGLGEVQKQIPKIIGFVQGTLVPFMKNLFSPGAFIKIGIALLGAFVLIKTVTKKLFSVNGEVGRNITTGIQSSVEMGYEKGSRIAALRVNNNQKVMDEQRKKRIMETWEFEYKQSKAFQLKTMAENSHMFKKIIGWGARMTEAASYGVKPYSSLLTITKELGIKAAERAKNTAIENRLNLDAAQLTKKKIENEKQIVESRLEQLKALGPSLTARQQTELDLLSKKDKYLESQNKKIDNQIAKIKGRGRDTEFLMKFVSPEDLANSQKALENSIKSNREAAIAKQIELEKTNLLKQAATSSTEALTTKAKELEIASKNRNLTFEEKQEYIELTKKIKEAQGYQQQIEQMYTEQNQELEQMNKEFDELKKEAKVYKEALAGKNVDTGELKKYQSFIYKARDAVGAVVRDIGSKLTKGVIDNKNNLIDGAKALVAGVKAAPGYLRNLGGGGAFGMAKGAISFLKGERIDKETGEKVKKGPDVMKGIGGVLGGVFGLLMGMAPVQKLLAGVMSAIKKPLESLTPMIEGLLQSIGPMLTEVGSILAGLFKDLMPIIMPVLKILLELIAKILKPLLPSILGLIKIILPILAKGVSIILNLLGLILKGLGHLPMLGFLKDIGAGMSDAAGSLWNLDLNTKETTAAVEDQTKKQEEDKAAVVTARDQTFITSSSASVGPDTASATASAQTQLQSEQVNITREQSKATEVTANATTELVALTRQMIEAINKLTQANKASLGNITERNI